MTLSRARAKIEVGTPGDEQRRADEPPGGTADSPKRLASHVVAQMRRDFPEVRFALDHATPFQLLIATILSAQCTDARVNQVTRPLFAKYRSAEHFANADLAALERAVQSTGFFRNKARNIRDCCRQLVALHGGEVPKDMEALVQLPGVGRKTANVVLGTAFGIPSGVVVDTHVSRLSRRMGLTQQTSPERIEDDLIELLPRREWIDFSHRLIHHGRQVCGARLPHCSRCSLAAICPRVGVVKSD